MHDLSSAARQLIARTRAGDDPGLADERRVEHALGRRIAAGAVATGAAATAAKVASAAGIAWGKTVLWVALGVGVTVGAVQVRRAAAPVAPSAAVFASARPVAARVVVSRVPLGAPSTPAMAPSEAPRTALSVPRNAPSSREPDRAQPSPPPLTSAIARFDVVPEPVNVPLKDHLAAETAALRTAQQAMRSGRPAEALALLDQQDATYQAGSLSEERAAARVLALCELGSVTAGRAAAEAFARRWPRSPLLGRVRTACDAR